MPGELQSDPLFVGLTRPPMLFGVSYTFALLNAFICMFTYVVTSDFHYLAILFPMHLVGYFFCSKDPLFLDLFKIKLQKCSRSKNRFYHGANSYDPY